MLTMEDDAMTTAELRRQAKQRLKGLSPEHLRVANEFLAYLETQESAEATAELLAIPGLLEAVAESEADIAAGRVVFLDDIRKGE